jgi:hypothetical protein
MNRITDDAALREQLAVTGPERASLFSWTATAEATLAALAQVTV